MRSRTRRSIRLGAAALGAVTLTVCATLAGSAPADAERSAEPVANRIALTTKAPYVPQGSTYRYERVPAGYAPVFTENVSRHGERTLTSSKDGDAVYALWQNALMTGGLTPLGHQLGPEVKRLLAANAAIGYGLLTGSGKQELADTANRMEERLPTLFHDIASSGTAGVPDERIAVVSSNVQRAVDSGTAYVSGLTRNYPALTAKVNPATTNNDLLYFHKSTANKDYQNYVANDPRVKAAEASARNDPESHTAAKSILALSFTPDYVASIAAGAHSAQFADDIAAAQAVYNLWAVTKDMTVEGPWHLEQFITDEGKQWFGYLDDVTSFYENGPAFAGDTITFKMAGVLLKDMFAQLDAKRAGTSNLGADLRFTHAEIVFPLATLLQLPGSTRQLPAGTQFTYQNDPFRGATVAPLGANVQWDLFRNGSRYLVRMLYNEQQTAFKSSCSPIRPGSYFYDLDALEQCYASERG